MEQTFNAKILNNILVLPGFAGSTLCGRLMKCEYGTPTTDTEVSGSGMRPLPLLKLMD